MSNKLEYRRYDDFMSTARKYLEKKDMDNAIKFFLLASKEMLEIAKLSSPSERKKHESQADKILDMVKELAIHKKKNKISHKEQSIRPLTPSKLEVKKEVKTLSVINYTRQIKLVKGKETRILFQLSNDTIDDQIYVRWESRYFSCQKELSNWSFNITDPIKPSKVQFEVLHKDTVIGHLEITFSKGYIENDLGL